MTEKSSGHLIGHLDIYNRERLAGWAIDPQDNERPLRLQILQDNYPVDEIAPDLARADLTGMGKDGRCAFDWSWPAPLPHEGCLIDVIDADTGISLPDCPVYLDPLPSELEGCIDIVDRQRITGWARDRLNPSRTVWLTLLIDGAPVTRIAANNFRRDLRDAGFGSGRHGFEHIFTTPLDPTAGHTIQLTHGTIPFATPHVLPRTTALDHTLQRHVTQILGSLDGETARRDALSYLIEEADKLRARSGATLTSLLEREQTRAASRLLEAGQVVEPCILIVDDRPPDPTLDAGSVALLSHIHALQGLGYRCCFVASRRAPTESDRQRLEALDITCLMPPTFTGPEEALKRLGNGLDAIYLHRLNNAESYTALARVFAPTATLVWSIADLASCRLKRQAAIEGRPELLRMAQRLEVRENMCAWLADAVIAHARDESDHLRRSVPTAQVYTIPWDVPVRSGSMPPRIAPSSAEHTDNTPPVIAFVAHFAHAPNIDAAKWLALEILPRLRTKRPDLVCRLIGSTMPHAVHMLAGQGIEIAGYVPDLEPALADVSVCVAPLRFGAGIKGKVLEAWSLGLPIAMTPIAAEGIVYPEDTLLSKSISDTAAGFADCILALLNPETAQAHIDAAQTLLRQRFTPDIVRDGLRPILPAPEPLPETDSPPVFH